MTDRRDIAARMDEAIGHHVAGRLREAAGLYAGILAEDSRQVNARHNLGMVRLGLGEWAAALSLLEAAFAEDGANPGWAQSLPVIGLTLFRQGFWEPAEPWLERAALAGAGTPEVAAALDRARPRDYLAPEVHDPLGAGTLRRHAPRESDTYVYAIDVAGTCNLKCPTCPVGNSALGGRPKGFMDVGLFRRILAKIVADRAAPRPEIFLFNWGEPLLHPRIGEIVGLVHEAGLASHLSTNLNVKHGFAALARANPVNLKISLSGFTPDTYGLTHARGDLALVQANLRRLCRDLDEAKATTRVYVGHHLYRNNRDQVALVAEACRELGFEHHPLAAFFQPLERLVEVLEGRGPPHPILDQLLEHPASYVPRIRASRGEGRDCELRFNQTVINFDGTVALCCSVYDEANMLGARFLEKSHAELEAMKYAHPFCRTCTGHGLHYAPADPALSGESPHGRN